MRTLTVTKTTLIPDNGGQFLQSDEAIFNFWSKVKTGAPDDCWLWQGGTNNIGYGQFRVGADRLLAHRISFLDVGGILIGRQVIRHQCHTTLCVNPAHLLSGTQKQNIQDSILAGRFKRADGATGGKASAAARKARQQPES